MTNLLAYTSIYIHIIPCSSCISVYNMCKGHSAHLAAASRCLRDSCAHRAVLPPCYCCAAVVLLLPRPAAGSCSSIDLYRPPLLLLLLPTAAWHYVVGDCTSI